MGIEVKILFFLGVGAAGILAALWFLHYINIRKRFNIIKEKPGQPINTISANYLQDLVSPNNMGRSINKVVEDIQSLQIVPEFHIDCFIGK